MRKAAEEGKLPESDIDRAASRILRLVFKTKKMQNYRYQENPDLQAHAKITRNSASEGMVLLKNESVLPIQPNLNVALLGVTSYQFIAGGTGSGDVNEAYSVSLEEGLTKAGFEINQKGQEIYQSHKLENAKGFEKPEGLDALFNPYTPPEIDYTQDQLSQIVDSSDMGILTLGRNAGEGGDRIEKDDFLLSEKEQKLLQSISDAYHKAGKKLVVVLNIGGVIETHSWKSMPDTILLAWQGGQEGGNSVSDILTGKVNPSGKLPMTFPVNLADHESHKNFPKNPEQATIKKLALGLMFPPDERPEAEKVRDEDYTYYEEDIYIGYRHFDKSKLEVSYPFGFGLSYTKFAYNDFNVALKNDTIHLEVTVKNIGDFPGKEVVQVYAEKLDSAIDRPLQELKAFGKTQKIATGDSEKLSLKVPVAELRYWNEKTNTWTLEPGTYSIKIAASSREIKNQQNIEL